MNEIIIVIITAITSIIVAIINNSSDSSGETSSDDTNKNNTYIIPYPYPEEYEPNEELENYIDPYSEDELDVFSEPGEDEIFTYLELEDDDDVF